MAYILNSEASTTERFAFEKFVEVVTDSITNEKSKSPITSLFLNQIPLLPTAGSKRIGFENAFRPEYISYDIYSGNMNYWALILVYNNVVLIDELNEDVVLKYPSISSIEELYFRLKPLASSDTAVSSLQEHSI